jgi:anti-anti-sigma factor
MTTASPPPELVIGQISSLAAATVDDVAVIHLIGEHDLSTVDELKTAIADAIVDGLGVVVSLAQTTFIDSTVIHALVAGDKRLTKRGRRLVFYVEPGSAPDRTLELCRLNEILFIADSVREAIVYASQSPDDSQA